MSLLWLRFALGCYFIGLIYAFVALTRTSELFSRVALHAASLGLVFHFVSLVEVFGSGHAVWASVHNSESTGVWVIGMRYKIVNAETTEQLATGYTEEKMEVGSTSTPSTSNRSCSHRSSSTKDG